MCTMGCVSCYPAKLNPLWVGGEVRTNHQGVDAGVEEAEHPDGGGHEAHTSPHAEHSAGVVVSLERRAALSLGEDDSRINDLVELGQVEEVPIKRQSLVPHPAALKARGSLPRRRSRRVRDSVLRARGTVQFTQRVHDADDAVGAIDGGNGAREALVHPHEGPGGVDGQEDVVEDDEPAEGGGLGDGPWLVAARGVDLVEGYDGDGVDGGDCEGHAGVIGGAVDAGGDGEGRGEGC